jgi:4-amino-4-deoxy-L-arabinose transferase-like glycosyltransferase
VPPAGPAHARLDGLELAVGLLGIGGGTAVWLALVLATFGLFVGAASALTALAVGAGVVLALGRRLRRDAPVVWPRPRELAGVAALLLLGAAILGRPHEYVLGGLDPGVYVNTGALIATSGGLIWRDATLAALPAEEQLALFREPAGPFVQGSRLVGFYIVDLPSGRAVPHGMHLFPAALALGQALGGLGLALYVPSLLAGLAVGGVALLARRLAGGYAGLLAALLLLLNPAETWFGRYPAAELAVQAFFFVGLVALGLALAARSAPLALLAGGLVGLVHLAKIETFVLPLALGLVFGWLWLTGRLDRLHGLFALGYAAVLLHALLHAGLIATHYAFSVYGRYLPPPPLLALCAALAVAAAATTLWRHQALRALARRAEARSDVLWCALAIAAGSLLAYGWLLRPLDLSGEVAATPEPLRFLVRNRLEALPRLGWYLPPLAILASAAGFLAAARRALWPPSALLLVALALEALVVLSDPRIHAEYPWAARRWVGLLVPGGVVLAAAFAAWLPGLVARSTRASALAKRSLAGVLGAAMLALSALASAPLLAHREYAGSSALIGQIAGRVDPAGVVLLDDDLVGWRFSAPLQFLGARAAFVPFGEASRDERAASALGAWRQLGRPLYWLRLGDAAPFERWGRRWTPLQTWRTELPEVVPTTEGPPGEVRLFAVPITLYRAAETP